MKVSAPAQASGGKFRLWLLHNLRGQDIMTNIPATCITILRKNNAFPYYQKARKSLEAMMFVSLISFA